MSFSSSGRNTQASSHVAGFQKQQERTSPIALVLLKSLLALHSLTCCCPNHMAENMFMSLLSVAEESMAFIS